MWSSTLHNFSKYNIRLQVPTIIFLLADILIFPTAYNTS